ncbi:MAG: HAD hydrolase family protein, partial [Muribaculaceae bacterium]|nr:HAD hydrolase family protein [Muribaculaceae bacterium]
FGDELSIIRSESFFLEVMNRGVEKGTSLAQLLQMIHVNPKNLMSFGDSYNDASMLRLAGWSVAMGNARKEIQALADEVTASNDENGVSQVVERRVLF